MIKENRQQWFLNNIAGEPHLIIDNVHQYHVCQHPSCKHTREYERILKKQGIHETSRKLMKRESYRLYDRKYPFDSTAKAIPLENIEDIIGTENMYMDEIVGDQAVAEFRETLTPGQQVIMDLLHQGYAPKDIAALQGKKDSGGIRWQKHAIKQRMELFYNGQN